MSLESVKVKRDGPRGWHRIDKDKYDANPKAYELYIEPPVQAAPPAAPKVELVTDPLGALPPDWKELPASKLKDIAAALSGRTPSNKAEATAMIEAAEADAKAKAEAEQGGNDDTNPPPPLPPPPPLAA